MVALAVRQGIVSNPVQLTVGKTTRLLLNMTRDNSSSTHTIEGWLKYGSEPVINRTISIRVNETLYSVRTNTQGHFVKVLGLQPINNNATLYVISASFGGDTAVTATASAKTLEGQDYPACTTIQYNDYKPSANSTTSTVTPRDTDGTTPTKTPDEIQKMVLEIGALALECVYRWQYPWFLIRTIIRIDTLVMKIIFSPILPGGEELLVEGLELFANTLWGFVEETIIDVFALFVQYVAAKVLSFGLVTWPAAAAALIFKGAAQFYLTMRDWYDSAKMLAATFVNVILALTATKAGLGEMFINTMFNLVWGQTMSAILMLQNGLSIFAGPIQHVRTWVDYAEIVMDIAFAVTSGLRYLDLIGLI